MNLFQSAMAWVSSHPEISTAIAIALVNTVVDMVDPSGTKLGAIREFLKSLGPDPIRALKAMSPKAPDASVSEKPAPKEGDSQ